MIEEEVLKKKIMSERMDLRESAAGETVSLAAKAFKWIRRGYYASNLHGIRHLIPRDKWDLKIASTRRDVVNALKRKGDRFEVELRDEDVMLEDFVHQFMLALFIIHAGRMTIKLAPPPGLRPSQRAKNPKYYYSYFSKISQGSINSWRDKTLKKGKEQLNLLYKLVVKKFNLRTLKEKKLIRDKLVVGMQDLYTDSVNSWSMMIDRFSGIVAPAGDLISFALEKTMKIKGSREEKNWIILCSAGNKKVKEVATALQTHAEKISLAGPAAKTARTLAGGGLSAREKALRQKIKSKYPDRQLHRASLDILVYRLHVGGIYKIEFPSGTAIKNETRDKAEQKSSFLGDANSAKREKLLKDVKKLSRIKQLKILEKYFK